jgi:conjugal transfer/entry exclusion protein
MAEEERIQFTGVAELSEPDQDMVKKISTEHYQKIKMSMKNLTSVSLHIKTIDKGGKKQYEILLKVIAPTHVIEASNSRDQDKWDLSRSLHKAFKNILREIEHKLKTMSQKPNA